MSTRRRKGRRGGALLAVLWLSAALAAIAFAVAVSVRGEVGRAESSLEGLKAEFLARGALDRAFNYMQYGPGPVNPLGQPRFWQPGMPLLLMRFPEGDTAVEIIPETSRINVNLATPEELQRLLLAMGLHGVAAEQITAAIVDWRAPSPGPSPFDPIYLSQLPSFRAPHASLDQIEDLLSVAGVTQDLFYGRYERTPEGVVIRRAGLRDCLSIYGLQSPFDINTVEPEVMVSAGVAPSVAMQIAAMRRMEPITPLRWPVIVEMLGPAAGRFRMGGDRIYTLRARARLREADGRPSQTQRSAAMTIQLDSKFSPDGTRVLRRYDNAAAWPTYFDVWPQ